MSVPRPRTQIQPVMHLHPPLSTPRLPLAGRAEEGILEKGNSYTLYIAPCGRTFLVHYVPGSLPTSPANPQSCQRELYHGLFPIPVRSRVWRETAAGTITPTLDLIQFVIDHAVTWVPHLPAHHLPATTRTTEWLTPRTGKHAITGGLLHRDAIRPLDQPTQ